MECHNHNHVTCTEEFVDRGTVHKMKIEECYCEKTIRELHNKCDALVAKQDAFITSLKCLIEEEEQHLNQTIPPFLKGMFRPVQEFLGRAKEILEQHSGKN